MIASTIAFARVILELAVVAPGILSQVAPPLGAMFVLMALISAGAYFLGRGARDEMPEQENPAELKSALIFGAILRRGHLRRRGGQRLFRHGRPICGRGALGSDLDAITLSTGRLAAENRIDISTGCLNNIRTVSASPIRPIQSHATALGNRTIVRPTSR